MFLSAILTAAESPWRNCLPFLPIWIMCTFSPRWLRAMKGASIVMFVVDGSMSHFCPLWSMNENPRLCGISNISDMKASRENCLATHGFQQEWAALQRWRPGLSRQAFTGRSVARCGQGRAASPHEAAALGQALQQRRSPTPRGRHTWSSRNSSSSGA